MFKVFGWMSEGREGREGSVSLILIINWKIDEKKCKRVACLLIGVCIYLQETDTSMG